MRVVTGFCLSVAVMSGFALAGDRDGAPTAEAQRKGAKKGTAVAGAPTGGVKTPGVQIPFASLKPELTFDAAGPVAWIAATDAVLLPSKDGLQKIDPKGKENKFGTPFAGLKQPCAGLVNAFTSLWVPNCGDGTFARVDPKTAKVTATLQLGTGTARPGIAATADSVWTFTDSRGTLSRIDPQQNTVVAQFRVYSDCNSLAFGETALWLTCPSENKVLRADPQTNLVDKAIEVSARPVALALGENSVWVLCEKDGKIDRIDPKTNKVTKTIELGAPAKGGTISIGEGSLWISMAGFPITRVDMAGEKVVQQFWGEGAGVIQAALGSVWLGDASGKVYKFDPKRIAATLAE
jgi:virginiamycin B lyase